MVHNEYYRVSACEKWLDTAETEPRQVFFIRILGLPDLESSRQPRSAEQMPQMASAGAGGRAADRGVPAQENDGRGTYVKIKYKIV